MPKHVKIQICLFQKRKKKHNNKISLFTFSRLDQEKSLQFVYIANTFFFLNRSPEVKEPSVEFDVSLLEEAENLHANEILWNNLTADSLQAM